MQEHELFYIFVDRLEKLNIRYMITGSVASMLYGEPRMTHDIDLIIELEAGDLEAFTHAFPSDAFYCPVKDVIRTEINRETRGHFNLIHHDSGFKADIYPVGRDEIHQWAIQNRRRVESGTSKVWLAPPEYVIVRKLQYYAEGGGEKHLRDIRCMLEVSRDSIDHKQLTAMVHRYHLQDAWGRCGDVMP